MEVTKKELDHKNCTSQESNRLAANIRNLCIELEQKSYMHRKVQFLLDIRGYLKLNSIKGNYVEFGSYKSEFQYAAYNILENIDVIDNYIGLDTFTGEPKLTKSDKLVFPTLFETDFDSSYKKTKLFVEQYLKGKGKLIKGGLS